MVYVDNQWSMWIIQLYMWIINGLCGYNVFFMEAMITFEIV